MLIQKDKIRSKGSVERVGTVKDTNFMQCVLRRAIRYCYQMITNNIVEETIYVSVELNQRKVKIVVLLLSTS